jgi:hypothetical protein
MSAGPSGGVAGAADVGGLATPAAAGSGKFGTMSAGPIGGAIRDWSMSARLLPELAGVGGLATPATAGAAAGSGEFRTMSASPIGGEISDDWPARLLPEPAGVGGLATPAAAGSGEFGTMSASPIGGEIRDDWPARLVPERAGVGCRASPGTLDRGGGGPKAYEISTGNPRAQTRSISQEHRTTPTHACKQEGIERTASPSRCETQGCFKITEIVDYQFFSQDKIAESKSKGVICQMIYDADAVFPYLQIARESLPRCSFRRGRWPLGDSRRHRGGLAAVGR